MTQTLALLVSDPALLPCLLARVSPEVDLGLEPGRALGLGFFENGQVLLRKRPCGADLGLEAFAPEVQSEVLLAAVQGLGSGTFSEATTEPYRFRSWLFAGGAGLVGARALRESLPEHLRRGLGGSSEAELAFLLALSQVLEMARSLDRLDIEAEIGARALALMLEKFDAEARLQGGGPADTSALLSNGRFLAALRRGSPLFYALVEGLAECRRCQALGREATHRQLRAVALTSRPVQKGLSWIEVPDAHLVAVSRSLEVRLLSLSP